MTTTVKRMAKPRAKKLNSPVRAHEQLPLPAPASETTSPSPEEQDEFQESRKYGFREGSDVAVIVEEMLRGGASKHEVASRAAKRFENQTTVSGNPKPVSTVMNQVIKSLVSRGFTVRSGWKLVPPDDGRVLPRNYRSRRSCAGPDKAPAALDDADAQVTQDQPLSSPQNPSQGVTGVSRPKPKPKPRARKR